MIIAKVENNKVTQVADYRDMFPNTSFPNTGVTFDFLIENGCVPVTAWKPHNSATEKLETTTPYIEDGQVYTVQVVARTQEELDAETQNKAAQVRAERNRLLSESDWTQVLDAPVNRSAWATYRQALRDISEQAGFPWEVQWPAEPA